MGDIIPRTSQLNLGVRLSPHPASDVLSLVRVDVRIAAMHLCFRTGRADFSASGSWQPSGNRAKDPESHSQTIFRN